MLPQDLKQSYSAFARWVAAPAWLAMSVAAFAGYWPPPQLCKEFEQAQTQQGSTGHIHQYATETRLANRSLSVGNPSGSLLDHDQGTMVDLFADPDAQAAKRERNNVANRNPHWNGERRDQNQARKSGDQLVPTVQLEASPEPIHAGRSPVDGSSVASVSAK